jgi:hypothetical protein
MFAVTGMDHKRERPTTLTNSHRKRGKHGRARFACRAARVRGSLAEGITAQFNRDVEEVKEVLQHWLSGRHSMTFLIYHRMKRMKTNV